MRNPWRKGLGAALAVGMLLVAGARARAADESNKLAEYFGFLPLEIYKLDARISNVLLKDLDGDKTGDVIVVNNGRSRIDLLLSTKGSSDNGRAAAKDDPNPVPDDRRMRLRSLPVNKEVVSLQTGDFNHDGKADLAYYGTPAEVIVLYNHGGGRFGDEQRISAGEGVTSGSALTVGDLDRDGRDDLALLTQDELVTMLQRPQGRLGSPERLPHTAPNPRLVKALDLDGDGGDDLVILTAGDDSPFRVRFAGEGGKLGPEQRFRSELPRAIAFANVDGKAGSEILIVENQSGRARVLTLAEGESDETESRGRLMFYPLPQGNPRGRSLALGDLDGDGRADIVVTDPANAQFLVYRQAGKSGSLLGAGQSFPGLIGGRTVRIADLDGDGKGEVVVLSEQEKQIGRSRFADGRLSFPTPLPVSGEPVMLEVADLDGDKKPEVLYVAREKSDKEEVLRLRALKREPSGTFVPFRWGQADSVAVPGLNGTPAAIRALDVNRDGQADILVFNPFGSPVLLLGRGNEPPAPASSLGPLAGISPTALTTTDLDGPALLVAQNSFARSLLLDKEGRWEVKDQFNSGRGSAQIQAATALRLGGDKDDKEIVLLDRTSKALLFLAKKEGSYQPNGSLSVGPLDFQGMHVADLDGDGRDDLLLAGTEKFGVVLTGRKGQQLKSVASYESSREDARFGDLAAGDLNGDGQPDIVLTDVAEHFIEIVTLTKPDELERALSFRIFEQKSFRDLDEGVEPRDLAVGDVNGDRREDLVLLVHNRVLIYRQDPGPEKTADRKP